MVSSVQFKSWFHKEKNYFKDSNDAFEHSQQDTKASA